MKKAVIILSGGMDSTTLLYDVMSKNYDVLALSFDYGQRHKIELEMAKKTCEKLKVEHKILNLDILNEIAPSSLTRKDWEVPEGHYESENMKDTVVPNRNMVMLSLAISYAIGKNCQKVFYGAHSGDHTIYPDCRKEFIDKIKELSLLCDWKKIEIEAPYWDIDKGDIVIKGKKLNVDYSLTYTCYNGNKLSCGKCGSCTERMEAFEKAKIKDVIKYE